ncbi:hypothetical protein KFL_007860040 [Klebsormidium nitens]|uniref:Uncharacterized protein n=1 Tax=Klebsormidium nitens TaxID=105231 RepID=A0A1Y1IMV9_KLENI|nr:hypothetical protein KFL_007860040 [Klebsormidium nitens]|eukprot:GAQ91442.1 hypothetical protein KFL_007860040 [Klebsormidium nitens]
MAGIVAFVSAVVGVIANSRATPLTESASLMEYEDRIYSCVEKAKEVWAKSGAALARAKAARDAGDFARASRYNLRVIRYKEETEVQFRLAEKYKKAGLKKMEQCRRRFGDCDTSAEAVDQAGVTVAMTESLYEEFAEQVEAFTKALGTFDALVFID